MREQARSSPQSRKARRAGFQRRLPVRVNCVDLTLSAYVGLAVSFGLADSLINITPMIRFWHLNDVGVLANVRFGPTPEQAAQKRDESHVPSGGTLIFL